MGLKFKGTQEKWIKGQNAFGEPLIATQELKTIAKFFVSNDEHEADRNIMLASKDMLEALIKISEIENKAFGLKGFDVIRFKKDINTVIKKALS